jgi:2-methylcitrate dehydratase PrpD
VTENASALARLGEFTSCATPPAEARARAARAMLDTVGVTLAGAREPASRIVRETLGADGGGQCIVLGTSVRTSAPNAALANGTAAHALDFDDMCFASLAHPSAPLVPATLAAGELVAACGRAVLDAYVVGFEIEGRLGRLMNPRHYQRGWHCTSTLGTIGAAAAASRVFGLDPAAAAHALAVAASEASGLKENFGTMVKPLHAGLAARNGVLAALLARGGLTASAQAIDGPQGFLRAMDSEENDVGESLADLGSRWEIVETGITVKLYPSCAGTHPALDAILDLQRRERFGGGDVERIEVDVDSITPTVLIYDRPATGLEAKFSMQYCAAAAVTSGIVGVETFEDAALANPDVASLMPRVTMRANPSLDGIGPPLTEARVAMTLRDGRVLRQDAHGARGYPERPASDDELAAKFLSCALRALPAPCAHRAHQVLRGVSDVPDIRELTKALQA